MITCEQILYLNNNCKRRNHSTNSMKFLVLIIAKICVEFSGFRIFIKVLLQKITSRKSLFKLRPDKKHNKIKGPGLLSPVFLFVTTLY